MKRGSFSVLYTSQLTVRTPSPIQPTSPEKSPHHSMSRELTTPKPTLPQADDIIITRTKSHVMFSIKIMSRLASTSRLSARFPGYNELSNWPRGRSKAGEGDSVFAHFSSSAPPLRMTIIMTFRNTSGGTWERREDSKGVVVSHPHRSVIDEMQISRCISRYRTALNCQICRESFRHR
jgi:hypothetical protein